MELTAAQLTTLKADITSDNSGPFTTFKSDPSNVAKAQAITDLYNAKASPDFFGNYKDVPLDAVKAAITFKNYTAADLPPASGSTTQVTNDLLLYLSRLLFAQNMQMSINNLLLVGTIFDATKANLVAGLKDATNTDMPTNTSGGTRKGGWSTVQTAICRTGTRLEKLFADTSSANGSSNTLAATFVVEGAIVFNTVQDAWLNH